MFPSFLDLFNAFTAKFKELKPTIDPTIKGSWAYAFGRGISASAYALVVLAKEVLKQFNPLTATGDFLDLWASYDLITRLGESPSLGIIRAYGIDTTVITSNESWSSQDNGLLYSNTSAATIQPQDTDTPPIVVLTLTRSGTTVTTTSSTNHGLSSNDFVRVTGADQTEYNIIAEITVIGLTQFTYEIVGTPVTPATGGPFEAVPLIILNSLTIVSSVATFTTEFANEFVDQQFVSIQDVPGFASFTGLHQITVIDGLTFTVVTAEGDVGLTVISAPVRSVHAQVLVQSDDNGTATVTGANSLFDYQGIIAGVDTVGKSIEGMQGGALAESDDELRSRLLVSRSAQEGVFTNDQIILAVLLINGNTRVFIQNPDSDQLTDPDPILPGQVRVYFLRDNDPLGPIPTGTVIALTKQSIILNGKLPAEMWDDDLQVLAPELLAVDIYLYNVLPSTATMRTAIRLQYEAYFSDADVFGQDLDDDVLRGVTIGTRDLESGLADQAFIKKFDWGGVTNSSTPDIAVTVANDGGEIRYNTATVPTVGDEVIVFGFTANVTYNVSSTVTFADGAGFKVGSIPFGTIESGEYTTPTETVGKAQLPILGKLTIDGIEV